MITSNMIECANFELDAEDVTLNKLMNGLVYSPSTKYGATVMSLTDNSVRIFLLDVFNMTFYEYGNEELENNTTLRKEMFYWYGDDCLVVLSMNTRNRKLHQVPVILNHKQKTYKTENAVLYNTARNFYIDAPSSGEAKTIMYKGEKYVLVVNRQRLYTFDIHAIPYHPYSALPLLKFILSRDVDEMLPVVCKTYNLDCHIKFSSQILVVDNIVHFPVEYYSRENNIIPHKMDLLGVHFAVDFEKLREATGFVLVEHDFLAVVDFMNEQSAAWEYKENIEVDEEMDRQLAKETFCRNQGLTRLIKGNHFLASQSEESGMKVTRVDCTDCSKRSITTVHKEYHTLESEVAACLTPYNILIARKLSPNRISCSIIQYPGDHKTVPTLKEMALAHTYLKYKNVNIL